MQKHEEAILRLLPQIGSLMELGLRPEWLSSDIRPYVEAAASLHMKGRVVSQLAVHLLVGTNGHWPQVEEVFGAGGVDPSDAVRSALSAYMLEQLRPIWQDVDRSARKQPERIGDWLPKAARQINEICKRGSPYDPSPTAHFKKPIPQVRRVFAPWLNNLLRGGLYSGAVGVISSAPSGGKSTMAYTLAASACIASSRCTLITGEELEQGVVGRVLMAMTGLDRHTVLSFQKALRGERTPFLTEREYKMLEEALERQERFLSVYNYEAMEVSRMDDIVAWEEPELLLVDHLLMVNDPNAKSRGSAAFDIGNLIYNIQRMVVQRYATQAVVFSQLPENIVTLLKKGAMPKHVTFYGSGMINQAANWSAVLYRHPSMPGFSRWWYIKDKVWDKDSDIFAIEHDPISHSFVGAEVDR